MSSFTGLSAQALRRQAITRQLREFDFVLEQFCERDAYRLYHLPTRASVEIDAFRLASAIAPTATPDQYVAALVKLAYQALRARETSVPLLSEPGHAD